MIVWLLILSMVILSFSAIYGAFLSVWYSTSNVQFSKTIALLLFIIGIVLLFIAVDWWWGLVGIVGFYLLQFLIVLAWRKRITTLIARGEDPWASGQGCKK